MADLLSDRSDRFYDSTTAYQGYGRQLDLKTVESVVNFAIGETRPKLTLLLVVPQQVSQERLSARQSTLSFMRDRIEEADRSFFERVEHGYQAIAIAEPSRVRVIDGSGSVSAIERAIWKVVERLLG